MDLSDILADASQGMAMRYTAVATVTLCVYEFLLTLDSELLFFWSSRFTLIKALFLANRYLPFFVTFCYAFFLILNTNANAQLCGPAFVTIGFMSFAGFILAEAVLSVRVYVIWQSRKSILILVSCLLGAKSIAAFAVTYIYLTSVELTPINLFRSGCEIVFQKRIEWITIFVICFFEIAVLSLMIMAKRAHLRRSNSELVSILVQDGVLYCICIMIISLVNVFIVKFAPPIISPFLVVTQGTLHNILCTRLLLRLRDVDARRRQSVVVDDGSYYCTSIPLVVTASTSRVTVSQ